MTGQLALPGLPTSRPLMGVPPQHRAGSPRALLCTPHQVMPPTAAPPEHAVHAGLDGMPPGMAKLDSLDLTGIDGGLLLQDLAVEQQRALGLHGGVPFMNRQNSGLQSMQSIEHALGDVEQVGARTDNAVSDIKNPT